MLAVSERIVESIIIINIVFLNHNMIIDLACMGIPQLASVIIAITI